MLALRTWSRALLVAILLTFFSLDALAQRDATKSQSTQITRKDTTQEERGNVGNPMLGVLIIIGVVGFLVFVAWVFSRVGHGGSRPSDGTMN
jgi:hypothetical protein